MINHLFTNRFTEGSVVSDIYVITDIRRGVTKSGKPYLSANLLDARGSVAMIAWEYEGGISPADNGELVFHSDRIERAGLKALGAAFTFIS